MRCRSPPHSLAPLIRTHDRVFSGVFQTAPYLPLQLVMNIKSDGPPCVFSTRARSSIQSPFPDDELCRTFDALDAALQPFLEQGWLTTVDTTNPRAPPKQSALTIVVTGNIQIPTLLNSPGPLRYIFYDAPLKDLGDDPMFNPAFSPMASATFSSLVGSRWVIPKLAKKKILEYVNNAHSKGISVRVTDPIDFPVWIRCVVVVVRVGLSPPPPLNV